LFAAGECAAGLHGANRLGGNSLSDLIVFGKLAGSGAAADVGRLSSTPKPIDEPIQQSGKRATEILNRQTGSNPHLLPGELEQTMQKGVGIVRTKAELETALEELVGIKKKAETLKAPGASQYNPGWHEALSMRSLLITSEVVTRAALTRE